MSEYDTLHAIVMDSGVGGFSILKDLVDLKLFNKITYLADQKFFPYGDKSSTWINRRLLKISDWANEKKPQFFVIACNSATVNSIQAIREKHDFQVVGVEPVVKPLSVYDKPLLLATATTLNSAKLNQLLTSNGNRTKILSHTPKNLVAAIESMDEGAVESSLRSLAKDYPLADAIGLSCTHYPLVKTKISQCFPDSDIIDPSSAVVKRVRSLLPQRAVTDTHVDWYTTGSIVRLKQQTAFYLNLDVSVGTVKI